MGDLGRRQLGPRFRLPAALQLSRLPPLTVRAETPLLRPNVLGVAGTSTY
jgi:hypothetical protein